MINRKRLANYGWIYYVLVLTFLLIIGLTGCGGTPPVTSPSSNGLPVTEPAIVIPDSPPEQPIMTPGGTEVEVESGQKLAITADASGAKRYEWTLQGDGELSATTGPAVLYTAPETDTIAIITVTAYNDQGASPSTSVTIKVSGVAAIRLDAVGIPAGWMSGKNDPVSFIEVKGGEQSECREGSSCLRFTYKVGASWNGILWWPLKCGDTGDEATWKKVKEGTCGVNVLDAGGNLTAINNLTFWARGDKGGEVIEFKVGDVAIPPSPGRGLGKATLTTGWEQYQIDLEGMDLTNAIALFTWVASDIDNPQGAVFYLSEIQFEGAK